MEANKENKRSKSTKNISKTRIPVPVKPLPLLPKHLIHKTINQVRAPLKTLESSNTNIASTSYQVQKTQEKTKIRSKTLKSCVRHVTTKNELFWTKNVFKDDERIAADENIKSKIKNNEVGTASHINRDIAFVCDDNSEKDDTVVYVDEQKLQVGKTDNTLVTPATAVIEHRGIRNVKKSLKRPHSRELIGLSPAVKDKTAEEKAKRRLLFDRLEDRLLSPDVWTVSYTNCLNKEYTIDIFPYLRSVESKVSGVPHIASITRACIINWLIKINGLNGNPAVIQSARWYLDSYLGLNVVPVVKLQLVAAACYWIAQKLHGPMFPASKMVLFGDNAFSAENLRTAEMEVLHDLRFPQQPVVPQEFITYLSWWCEDSQSGQIECAATFICITGMMVDKSLCNKFPSAIAAASVKTAIQLLGKEHLIHRLLKCHVYQSCDSNLRIESLLLRATKILSSPVYEYKVLLEYYGLPPYCIAQKVIEAVNRSTIPEPQH